MSSCVSLCASEYFTVYDGVCVQGTEREGERERERETLRDGGRERGRERLGPSLIEFR